jgi:hypothetical protein
MIQGHSPHPRGEDFSQQPTPAMGPSTRVQPSEVWFSHL